MTNKIKILFFIPDLNGGGAERALINLLHRMDPSRYDITVRTIFDQGVYKEDIPAYVTYRSTIKKRFKGFVHIAKLFAPRVLFRFFIREPYDVIVPYYEGAATRIAAGCTDKHTKLITLLHLEAKEKRKYLKPYRSLKEMEDTYNKYDYICSVSETALASLKEKIHLKKPSGVINNIIEVQRIRDLAEAPVTEISFPDNGMIFGSLGRLDPQKGYVRLIEILHRLDKEHFTFTFYILGTGGQQELLEQEIKKYGLENKVFLLGYHKNPYKFLRKFDMFVCSSYYEGLSTVVCEAIIVGKPVLTTLCSGMREVLGENNEYGIITENSDQALYEGLKHVLMHPELLSFYREKAMERSLIFDPEQLAGKLDALFETVAKGEIK